MRGAGFANTDIWRATASIDSAVGFCPVGGAWLTTHMWQHYLFTGHRKFLENSYPVFKNASLFFLDILVEEPTHHWLVTCPSMSPEHGGLVAFRHAFVSQAFLDDASEGEIREWVGHTNSRIVERYRHLRSDDAAKNGADRFFRRCPEREEQHQHRGKRSVKWNQS
jgi:hypothetical protein